MYTRIVDWFGFQLFRLKCELCLSETHSRLDKCTEELIAAIEIGDNKLIADAITEVRGLVCHLAADLNTALEISSRRDNAVGLLRDSIRRLRAETI